MNALGLYIHIPFCDRKCHYCDFASFAGKDHLTERYVGHLNEEIRQWGAALGPTTIRTINFGGGTPSLLSGPQIAAVLAAVRESYEVPKGIEISLEANPGTVTLEKLSLYKEAGVNRLSFGVQSFDEKELKRLGRIHTAEDIFRSFESARAAGIGNINLDFMFALPDQMFEGWQSNLKQGVALGPDHISTYNLQIEEATPFYAAHQRGQLNLPDEDTELAMYEWAIGYIKEAGYRHYEISNFAKPGMECRHNLIYWRNENWLGVGSGAHSHLDGHRFANPDAVEAYLKLRDIPSRRLIEMKSPSLLTDRIAETMMMGLRLHEGVSLKDFQARFGAPIEKYYSGPLVELAQDGLIEVAHDALRLSPRGLPLANLVFERFI